MAVAIMTYAKIVLRSSAEGIGKEHASVYGYKKDMNGFTCRNGFVWV